MPEDYGITVSVEEGVESRDLAVARTVQYVRDEVVGDADVWQVACYDTDLNGGRFPEGVPRAVAVNVTTELDVSEEEMEAAERVEMVEFVPVQYDV